MRLIDADKIVYMWTRDADGEEHDGIILQSIINKMPTITPDPHWIPCSECKYWQDERVLMKDGRARQYNGDEPDELGTRHSVSIDVGINEGARCLYEKNRGWGSDHTTFRNVDDFCSRAEKRPCSYEKWWGIVDGIYAERWKEQEDD